MLGRASELFQRLTLGSFAALRIDFDEDGEQVLAGVRPDGGPVLPQAMSEGTSDQLYLALRLASLEIWLRRGEPMPFIVDDILVSFDNRRAAATLAVLAEPLGPDAGGLLHPSRASRGVGREVHAGRRAVRASVVTRCSHSLAEIQT